MYRYSIFTKEMFVHTAGHLANKDCESCSKAPDPEALFGCSCKQRGDTSVKSWGSGGGGGLLTTYSTHSLQTKTVLSKLSYTHLKQSKQRARKMNSYNDKVLIQ